MFIHFKITRCRKPCVRLEPNSLPNDMYIFYRLWFTLTLSQFYVCVSARFLKNGWTNLHELIIHNAYGATDISFGFFFDPLTIAPF